MYISGLDAPLGSAHDQMMFRGLYEVMRVKLSPSSPGLE